MFQKLTSLKTYTAHTTTIIFIFGFVFDAIMLPDIDHPITRYIGLAHICIVAFFIMIREWIVSRNTASETEQKLYSISSFLISFSSGAALSFIFVYSFRSAALLVSWPLLLLLALCIIANEFVATHNFRFTLDVGVLLVAVLFFVVFNMPLLLKTQNDMTFAISVGVSVGVSLLYLFLLQFTSESASYEAPRTYALAIGIPMFVGMLYFLNVIPAVPLSLANAGAYHYVSRNEAGGFVGKKEKDTRFLSALRTPQYHISSTDSGVYFFSAVSAPAELTAPISHVWEYYDPTTKRWQEKTRIAFTLAGGREDGYRAYSLKEHVEDGLWRVTVKVDDKRIVGRAKFRVIQVEEPPSLTETRL
jgi:hypothetical protein